MKITKRDMVLFACAILLLWVPSAAGFQEIDSGVYRFDSKAVDDLLNISSRTDLNVLVLEDEHSKSISDAHMKVLRQWVESGGVLWVAGDGLESALAQTVAPFRIEGFDFVRSSSGNRGGELIVKGLSPRMTIADHVLTAGVNRLYLFAQTKFDGTERAEPLVTMGDTSGNSGWVIAAVPIGQGFMVLDGTARKEPWLFGRLQGFDKDHLNSLKQGSGWNNYDWNTLRLNARDHARQELGVSQGLPPSGR